jgi:acyl-CoA reductase-like NAD-dependent aldehyde dehydrogenase
LNRRSFIRGFFYFQVLPQRGVERRVDRLLEYKLFINNEWVSSHSHKVIEVENPATRGVIGTVARADAEDVHLAVNAASAAFPEWSGLSAAERAAYMRKLADTIEKRKEEFCDIITAELGMPRGYVYDYHVAAAISDAKLFADIAEAYIYEEEKDDHIVVKEPYGVVAGITPWNYPLTQATTKLFAAMAAGNTVVLKPSRQAPLCCLKLAECVATAGIPAGVFNVVTGVGGEIGNALADHKGVAALSFTGSTRAGIEVGQRALSTVKKLTLELGGKSPLILLPEGNAAEAVSFICPDVFMNSGQTCCSYTRFLIPKSRSSEVEKLLISEAASYVTGDPLNEDTTVGPLISAAAYNKVRGYIAKGIEEGARLIVGELPEELTDDTPGYYVKPAVFMDVTNDMSIAREEIFGPVISVIEYEDEEEAVRIANDTDYGLAGAVFGGDDESAMKVARRIRAGYLSVNGVIPSEYAPFGGYKMSGFGKECGPFGFEEFLQVKTIALDMRK